MESKADGSRTSSKNKEGLWWRWTHGKSGTTASSSHVASPASSHPSSSSNSKAGASQKRATRTPKEESGSSPAPSLSWSTSPESSSSPKFFTAATSSRSVRSSAIPAKKKATPSVSNRGPREAAKKSALSASSSSSAFVFSSREDKRSAPSDISWSVGKSKRQTARKDRRSTKSSSSMLSSSRAGTRVVATRGTNFLPDLHEDTEMRAPDTGASMFGFSTQANPSRSSGRGSPRLVSSRSSSFALTGTEKVEQPPAAETPVFDFDASFLRCSKPVFAPSSPSAASTTSTASSFSSQSFSTVDPLVNCARAVLQDCIMKRKLKQSSARKRSIEGCIGGDLGESKEFGWHYDSVSKHRGYGAMSPGSSSSSDDELSQLSSMDQSFCIEKPERGCDSKLAKEEMYRQILVGDYDLSSSPEFQSFSPLIEEQGLPIEVRYQLPLALGTANETNKECTICQLRYGIGDHIVTLPCQHFFHACCVDKWLWNHTSCPLCRTEVSLDQDTEVPSTKHNFTECSPVDQERIRRQMRSSSQHAGFRPVVPVEIDQLELDVSRMAIDEDSEVEDEPSYLVCPTPHLATSAQDNSPGN